VGVSLSIDVRFLVEVIKSDKKLKLISLKYLYIVHWKIGQKLQITRAYIIEIKRFMKDLIVK